MRMSESWILRSRLGHGRDKRPDRRHKRRLEMRKCEEQLTSSPPDAAVICVNAGDDTNVDETVGSVSFRASYVVKNAAADRIESAQAWRD